VLVYCSDGYFTSKNCMRELVATLAGQKPIIALMEPDPQKGGLSMEHIHELLLEADLFAVERWNFLPSDGLTEPSTREWHGTIAWPGGETLRGSLFRNEPIEWNRIGHFQGITMRLIAERVLPTAAGNVYIDGELTSQKLKPLPPPTDDHDYHLFCSTHNFGAAELIAELAEKNDLTLKMSDVDGRRRQSVDLAFAASRKSRKHVLVMTTNADCLSTCDHMLLYLTSQTWTRGAPSAALADEVGLAMDQGVHMLLAHEMLGLGQDERFACDFGSFFSCAHGTTPTNLLKGGIYSEIAVPLKGGPWRGVSMALLSMALGMSKEEMESAKHGGYVLKLKAHKGTASFGRLRHLRRAGVRAMRRKATEVSISVRRPSVKAAREAAARELAPSVHSSAEGVSAHDDVEDAQVQILSVASGPLGIGLVQRDGQIVVSSVDVGSAAAAQCVAVGGVLNAVNDQPVSGLEKDAAIKMIRETERPLRLRILPPAHSTQTAGAEDNEVVQVHGETEHT